MVFQNFILTLAKKL